MNTNHRVRVRRHRPARIRRRALPESIPFTIRADVRLQGLSRCGWGPDNPRLARHLVAIWEWWVKLSPEQRSQLQEMSLALD